jgi:hypothetical protein
VLLGEVRVKRWQTPGFDFALDGPATLVVRNPQGGITVRRGRPGVSVLLVENFGDGNWADVRAVRRDDGRVEIAVTYDPTVAPLPRREAQPRGLAIPVLAPFETRKMEVDPEAPYPAPEPGPRVHLEVSIPNDGLRDLAMIGGHELLFHDMAGERYVYGETAAGGRATIARAHGAKLLLPPTGLNLVECRGELMTAGFAALLAERFGAL